MDQYLQETLKSSPRVYEIDPPNSQSSHYDALWTSLIAKNHIRFEFFNSLGLVTYHPFQHW
jgi:hypothetical protein